MNPDPATAAPSVNGHMNSLEFMQSCLAGVQANIFIADSNLIIVYANDRALETLRGIENEVRAAFDVEVDDIVGATIHRFHKDKRRVERILRNPGALPHQAEFTFGLDHLAGQDQRRLRCQPARSRATSSTGKT